MRASHTHALIASINYLQKHVRRHSGGKNLKKILCKVPLIFVNLKYMSCINLFKNISFKGPTTYYYYKTENPEVNY
jgi:hypothetical protein